MRQIKHLFVALALVASVSSAWADANGTCGTNLTWTYVESTHTLTISGTGQMTSFPDADAVPWKDYKTAITSIVLQDGITEIDRYAFRHCTNLTSVTLSEALTAIAYGAFYNCSSLTSITIPSGVTGILSNAFQGCTGLTDVYVHWNTPLAINSDVFSGVTISGVKLHVPYGTTSLYSAAAQWSSFNIVEMNPQGKCGENLYWEYDINGTHALTITGTGDMDDYDHDSRAPWYSYRNAITTVVIENGATGIGTEAFNGCSALTSVTIPSSVTTIWNSAFYGCTALASIEIPSSVSAIENGAFEDSGLKDLYVNWTGTPPTPGPSTFSGVDVANVNLHVPAGTYATYAANNRWKVFNIVDPYGGKCGDNLIWVYDPSTTTLTITGSGAMTDFGNLGSAPWNSYSSNITSISLPEGLTHIGNNAFYGCSNKSLTSVAIPASVTSIGTRAFHYCSRLKTVNIPDGVTSIGNSAFANSAITSVAIPASVTSIGTNPFTSADLVSITVDPNNPNYDSRGDCNAIIEKATNTLISGCKNTVIPDDVEAIGICAFEWCSGLEYISIPASVASFGDYAFNYCSDLYMMFVLRKSPAVTLGANVFGKQGVNMHLPSIISVPEGAYDAYWDSWTSKYPDYVLNEVLKDNLCGPTLAWRFNSSNTLLIYGYGGAIFDYASSDDVPWLGDRANIKKIEFYLLSGNITHIGSCAFAECNNAALTSVTIPNTVTSIGFSAFRGCTSLTSIALPNSLTSIGAVAFEDCSSLASVTIPSGVTTIGEYAFDECSSLASANIPDGVTLIDAGIFNGCSSLGAITIPSGVTEIKQYAFHNTALTTIDIPIGVTSIGYYAFLDCTDLTDVTVHWTDLTGVTTSSSAFNGVTVANVNLHVPAGTYATYAATAPWSSFNIIDPIGGKCGDDLVWAYNSSTTTLTISGTGEMYNYTASTMPWKDYCSSITSISLPAGLTQIGEYAFSGCGNLSAITFPDGLLYIGQMAFDQCSTITSLTIPQSVGEIINAAFRGCTGLTDVYVSWTDPSTEVGVDNNIFEGVTTSAVRLHFPEGSDYNYLPWSAFMQVHEGTCATGLTWTLVGGELTITGSGNMPDYNYGDAPWFAYADGITSVTLPDGLTHVGNNAFVGCYNMETINFPDGLLSIGAYAIEENFELTSITIPSSVTSIGAGAFLSCDALAEVNVSWTDLSGVTIDPYAFNSGKIANIDLNIPDGTYYQYAATAPWSGFHIVYTPADYVITANPDPNDASTYYSTFYDGYFKYIIPEYVEAYAAARSGSDLILEKIGEEGDVLPAGTAVILKATTGSFTLVPTDLSPMDVTATNQLQGVDVATPVATAVTSGTCYVLSGHSSDNTINEVGFYTFSGTLGAHKAYLVIPGASPAPKHLRFVFDQENNTTDIESPSLQGRSGEASKILRDGVLYIQRGEKLYDATGRLVKE